METTLGTHVSSAKTHQVAKQEPLSKFWQNLEFNRFGIISMQLFIMGCISGIAASYGADGDIIKLAMVAFPTIIALASTLAVSPMKVIVYLSSFAILCDLLVFAF